MEDHRRGMKLENSGEDDNIKPIETSITYPKKVRVMVSDPDATDSSSDETGDGERSLPRRIIREIVLGVRAGDEALKPTDSVDQKQKKKKLRGVRMRKWGKWCAEVRDPLIKKRLWLGTFNTAEEAAKVYNAKKEEIRARLPSQSQPIIREREINNSLNVEKMVNLDQNPTRKRSKGVRKMNSGRWGVKIRDPFKKSQVWLGTYDTEEEASKAFELKKMEFVSKRTLSASKIGSYLKTPKTETLTLGSAHGGEIVVGN